MLPKTEQAKQDKNPNYANNLTEYIELIWETLNDENFERYAEFSYLISRPEFHLLPGEIKEKALKLCHEYFKQFWFDWIVIIINCYNYYILKQFY